jgi:hypothetical protein
MNSAADRKLFVAPLSKGSTPRRISFRRAERSVELFLLWHLASSLLWDWRARVDPIGAMSEVVVVGAFVVSKADRAALAKELAEYVADPGPLPSTAMLDAVTRWFSRIRLPVDEDYLLGGSPLHLRFSADD